MEKTTKKVSKKMQKFVSYNPEQLIYYPLLEKLFLNECIDYYSNRWNSQYTEKDVFECDEYPPLFNEYILDNHEHVMFIDKQAKGYNFYIQIYYYENINEIDEDGDMLSYRRELEDKSQCFFYKSKTNEFIEITENEYNNYLKLNEISYSKRNKICDCYIYSTFNITKEILDNYRNKKKIK